MARTTRRVTVLGWYGHSNAGDELMLEGIHQLFKDWQVSVMSNSVKSVYPVFDPAEVNDSDLFVLGGGELIQRGQLFLPSYWTDKIKAEIPKIILGCGVNAIKYNQLRLNVHQELDNFRYIGLRDNYSVKMIGEVNRKVGLFYDTAFSIDTSNVKTPTQNERNVIVIPTDRNTSKYDAGILQHNFASKFAKWLDKRLSLFDRVQFLAFGAEDSNDYEVCRRVSKEISVPSSVVDCSNNFKAALEAVAGANRVYTCRLHGLVLSKLFSKPCAYYPYHWKLDRVAETILGCEASLIASWQRQALDKVLAEAGLCD